MPDWGGGPLRRGAARQPLGGHPRVSQSKQAARCLLPVRGTGELSFHATDLAAADEGSLSR